MWIFTDTGFVSAVTHRDDSSLMMVRARDKESLNELHKMSGEKLQTTVNADYPYRITVSKELLKEWMSSRIDAADYDNYKSRVQKTRGTKFVAALHEVWEVMTSVEDIRRWRP